MAKYKYRLVKNNNWRFELLPNNSDTQYVGRSCEYPTKKEALRGLIDFKTFLRNQSNFPYEQGTLNKANPYFAFFVFSNNDEKFYTRRYQHKYETHKSIKRIKNNFEVDIRDDLTIIKKENEL